MFTRLTVLLTTFALIFGLFAFATIAPQAAEDVPVVAAFVADDAEAHLTCCAPYWKTVNGVIDHPWVCDTRAHEYYYHREVIKKWLESHDNVNFYYDHHHVEYRYNVYTGYWC